MLKLTDQQRTALNLFTQKPRQAWQKNTHLAAEGADGVVWASNGASLFAIPLELDDFAAYPTYYLKDGAWLPVDYAIPDFDTVLERARCPTGEAAQYDPELLLLFKQAAKELGDPTGFFKVHHNGPQRAGTVHFKDLKCWGLIMPYVDYIGNQPPPELTTLNGE
ncbi:MAG TPA: hypothetical protein VFV43_01555 [Limnobacter sp.]|nr:hypothetical protein [Limnobacter sp.]